MRKRRRTREAPSDAQDGPPAPSVKTASHTARDAAHQEPLSAQLASLEDALQEQRQRLEVYLQLGRALNAATDVAEVMQMLVDSAAEVMHLSSSALYLLEGETLRLASTFPALPPGFPEELLHAPLRDHPHIAKTITSGHPVVVADTTTADFTPAEQEVVRSRDLRSILYLPVQHQEQPVGVLIVSAIDAIRRFSQEEIRLLQGFADHAAQIIDSARRVEASMRQELGLKREVAKRRQAEEVAQAGEAMLARAQAIAHVGSWTLDLVEKRLTWSDEVYRIFGCEPKTFAVTYASFLQLVHPDDRVALENTYVDSMRDGLNRYDTEHRIVRPDTGEIRYLHERCEHERNAHGKIIRSVGMVHDITERVRAEQALWQERRQLQEAQAIAHVGSWEYDALRDRLVWSDETHRIFGTTPGSFEETYEAFLAHVHPEDRSAVEALYAQSLDDPGVTYQIEHRLIRSDTGEERHVLEKCRHERDSHGQVIRSIGVVHDITELRRVEAERERTAADLRERSLRLQSILEHSPLLISEFDTAGRYLFVNPANAAAFNLPASQVEGKTFRELLPEDVSRLFMERVKQVLCDASPLRVEETIPTGGDIKRYLTTLYPLPAEDGRVRSIGAIAHDITQQALAEEDARRSEAVYRALFQHAPVALVEADFTAVRDEMDTLGAAGVTDLQAYFDEHPGVLATWQGKIRLLDANIEALKLSGAGDQQQLAALTRQPPQGISADALRQAFVKLYRGATRVRWRGTARDPRGDLRHVTIRHVVVPGHEKKLDRVLVVMEDRTEEAQAHAAVTQSYKRIRSLFDDTVGALAAMAELRDPYTAGHQRQVARLACAIAELIGIDEDRIEGLRVAALLHDVGKICVPADILNKPTQLNELEFSLIKEHVQVGGDILQGINFPWPVAQIVLQHHERLDGSGYPQALLEADILLEAQCLAVADVVEAMASHRPYRPELGIRAAIEEITHGSGALYNTQAVAACVELIQSGFSFADG